MAIARAPWSGAALFLVAAAMSAAPARAGSTAATGPAPMSRLARSYIASSLRLPSLGAIDG